LENYYDLQKDLALQINDGIGSSEDWWQVAPLPAGEFSLGDVLEGGFPKTELCRFPPTSLENYPARHLLPNAISNNFAVSVSAGFPSSWARYFDGSFSLNDTSGVYVAYSNLHLQIINPDKYSERIKRGDCSAKLSQLTSNGPAVILVGYIYGQATLRSYNGFNGSLAVKTVQNAGVTVSVDSNGGFCIQDTNAVPCFAIVSSVTVKPFKTGLRIENVPDTATNTSEYTVALRRPTFRQAVEAVTQSVQ
jgi:hypothetical protein